MVLAVWAAVTRKGMKMLRPRIRRRRAAVAATESRWVLTTVIRSVQRLDALIAPQLWKSLKLSDTQILQNIESARASRLSLVNQVNEQPIYTLLLRWIRATWIQESYDMARFTDDCMRASFELGAATKYDVLRTEGCSQEYRAGAVNRPKSL